MEKYSDQFMRKNSELQRYFIYYEVFMSFVFIGILMISLINGFIFIPIFSGIVFVVDLALNNTFLQETIRNNKYYATTVLSDPSACTKGVANTLEYNRENYLNQYRAHRKISRLTLLVMIIARNLEEFYTNITRDIEVQLEQK